jgi:hypothetical protein
MLARRYPYRKPDQQGRFDGLCGVCAILNSIKRLYHFSEDDLDKAFRSLCENLWDKFPQALWNGLGVPELLRLLICPADYLAENHGHEVLYVSIVTASAGQSVPPWTILA